MSKQIVELYSDGDMERMRQREKRWRTALLALGAAALAVCVTLTACTDTLNAPRMELAVIAVSTLAGWVGLYWGIFKLTPARRELAHARMLRTQPRQRIEGTVTVTGEGFAIKKSVAVRRVELRAGEETERLLVCAGRAQALAAANASALYVCHGYAAAYEVDG